MKNVHVMNDGPDRKIRHEKLRPLVAIPVAPGGFTNVKNGEAEILASQAFIVPKEAWELSPGLWRQQGLRRISEAEYNEVQSAECRVQSEPLEGKTLEIMSALRNGACDDCEAWEEGCGFAVLDEAGRKLADPVVRMCRMQAVSFILPAADLSRLTMAELREELSSRGIAMPNHAKKAELVKLLSECRV